MPRGVPVRTTPAWLLLALVLAAGCAGLSPAADTPKSPPTPEPLPTVEPATETTRCHCLMNGRFELHHLYDGRVTVRVDGEPAWAETISRAEGYAVTVTENGSVRVTGHVMT